MHQRFSRRSEGKGNNQQNNKAAQPQPGNRQERQAPPKTVKPSIKPQIQNERPQRAQKQDVRPQNQRLGRRQPNVTRNEVLNDVVVEFDRKSPKQNNQNGKPSNLPPPTYNTEVIIDRQKNTKTVLVTTPFYDDSLQPSNSQKNPMRSFDLVDWYIIL